MFLGPWKGLGSSTNVQEWWLFEENSISYVSLSTLVSLSRMARRYLVVLFVLVSLTLMARTGYSDAEIQRQGIWRSSAFLAYCKLGRASRWKDQLTFLKKGGGWLRAGYGIFALTASFFIRSSWFFDMFMQMCSYTQYINATFLCRPQDHLLQYPL